MTLRSFAFAVTLLLSAAFLTGGTASAYELTEHAFSTSFDGTGTSAGPFGTVRDIAVDQETGSVYVATSQNPGVVVSKFNSAGLPESFSDPSVAGTSLSNDVAVQGPQHVAVDNSATATAGRIYLSNGGVPPVIWAYERSGASVGVIPAPNGKSPTAIAVHPVTGNLWITSAFPSILREIEPDGTLTGVSYPLPSGHERSALELEIDSEGNFYLSLQEPLGVPDEILKFDPDFNLLHGLPDPPWFGLDPLSDEVYSVNPSGVSQFTPDGSMVARFGSSLEGAVTVAVNGQNGRVYVGRQAPANRVDVFGPGATVTLPDVTTDPASDFEATSVELHGTVDPSGVSTTQCRFEWSIDTSFSQSAPCVEGDVLGGSGTQQVTAVATGLTKGQRYHYRLSVANPDGKVIGRQDRTFVPSTPPALGDTWISEVHSDGMTVNVEIDPGGADTEFHIEYGPADCATISCASTADVDGGSGLTTGLKELIVHGLRARHHLPLPRRRHEPVRRHAWARPDVHDLPLLRVLNDPCPNAHVRQQTGAGAAARLPRLRAGLGGEHRRLRRRVDLVAGQTPFGGYPQADRQGPLRGPRRRDPGHRQPDQPRPRPLRRHPRRATSAGRTDYVGIPADCPVRCAVLLDRSPAQTRRLRPSPSAGRTSATPASPTASTRHPAARSGRQPRAGDGRLAPAVRPRPGGRVEKRLSADGTHFVFGSTQQFEPEGNSNGTDVTIYDRDLETGHHPGRLDAAERLDDRQRARASPQLDVSADGSRILIGAAVSTDSEGNELLAPLHARRRSAEHRST